MSPNFLNIAIYQELFTLALKDWLHWIPGVNLHLKHLLLFHNWLSEDMPYFITQMSPNMVQHFLSTSVQANNVHSTKRWKFIARMDQRNNVKEDTYQPPSSCEEGSDAIPHAVLINQLQKCKSVSEQIETFCSKISITPEDIGRRKLFCNSLVEALSPYFTDFRIHLFGSTVNGLGFKGCDVDVSIQTIFNGQEYLKDMTEVPTLNSVIQGTTTADTVARLPPRFMLRFVRRIIRAHCADVREPIILIKARCPILRFYNAKYDVYCDFSCENQASLCNTKLLRLICQLDQRFATLAKLIRYWGKYGGFVGDIDMFNSYSFSLLVVHFLQQTHPPVLPPIKEMIEKSSYLSDADVNDDDLLVEDLKKFQPSKNSQRVEELMREFFFYFLNFDHSRMMMIPLTSSVIPRDSFTPSATDTADSFEFSTVTVQDPFRHNFNVTSAAVYKTCSLFRNGIVEGCKTYQDETVWCPSADTWGICSLFQKPMSVNDMVKEWPENHIHTIKLPFKMKASIVKDILQECLLFKCSEMNLPERMGSSLKLNCEVFHKTWLGRDCFLAHRPPSLTHPLEMENWISKQVLQGTRESKNQVIFTFSCECYENESDNELKIVLSFKKSKASYVVAIFLKDYIPTMCKRLFM